MREEILVLQVLGQSVMSTLSGPKPSISKGRKIRPQTEQQLPTVKQPRVVKGN